VMWFSGLRGAVSFALAMSLDDPRYERQVMHRSEACLIITTTLAIIFVTNACFAPMTSPLISSLSLTAPRQQLCTLSNTSSLALRGSSLRATHLPLLLDETDGANAPAADAIGANAGTFCANSPIRSRLAASQGVEIDGDGSRRDRDATSACSVLTSIQERSALHKAWRQIDQAYMKPLFGGRPFRDDGEDTNFDDED